MVSVHLTFGAFCMVVARILERPGILGIALIAAGAALTSVAHANTPDPARDILVTFENAGISSTYSGARYRYRKRYPITNTVRHDARAVAEEYGLVEVDHWPITSLSVYCFVYRIADGEDRDEIIASLEQDERIDSAQPLNQFEVNSDWSSHYDDTFANLQHGLTVLDVDSAHRVSTGRGVRVAIVDSYADKSHEDLRGRISRHEVFSQRRSDVDSYHGTAVSSIIGARSNNARGIVGIAPEADLQVFVSCWRDSDRESAICDTFTLLKALDSMLEDPPEVLNMSLTGPHDPLLRRVLLRAIDEGVVIVAACPTDAPQDRRFPASMREVIGVARSEASRDLDGGDLDPDEMLFAPGDRILVAIPENDYDFRSGSSLSAAHVSGIVALLLAEEPDLTPSGVFEALHRSQSRRDDALSVNACEALQAIGNTPGCTVALRN